MSDTLTPEQMRKHLSGGASLDVLTPEQMRQHLATPAGPARPGYSAIPGVDTGGPRIDPRSEELLVGRRPLTQPAEMGPVTMGVLGTAEAMQRIGEGAARRVVDPIKQAAADGTAGGWIKGGVRAVGGVLTAPVAPALTANEMAQEELAKGNELNPIARTATAIGNAATLEPAFTAYNEALPDFDAMAAESKRLGMPIAEYMANVAAAGKDILPFVVGAAANKAAPLPGAVREAMARRAAFERSQPTRVAIDPASVEYTGGRSPRAPVAPERLPMQGEPQALPAPEAPQAPPPRPVADLRASRPPMPLPREPWMPPRPMPLAGPIEVGRAPGTKTGDQVGTKLTTAPAEVVKPTHPEPAQAPAVSEEVPTISDKPEPYVQGSAHRPMSGAQSPPIESRPAPKRFADGERQAAVAPGDPALGATLRSGRMTSEASLREAADALEARDPASSGMSRGQTAFENRQKWGAESVEDLRGQAEYVNGFARGRGEAHLTPEAIERATARKAPTPAEVEPFAKTQPEEPPLVAKMRAEPDLEARAAIWRDTVQRGDRNAIGEAESWARKAQKARGEKDGLVIGRDAVERELNPPKPKKAKKDANLGAKRKGREGPTLGVGLGAVGTKGRNWIETAESGINAVTGRAIGAAQEMFPRADAAVGKLHEWALMSPEDAISPEVGATLRAGRSLERRLQMRADAAIRDLLAVEKSVTPEMRDQIARSLNSEDSDINPLTEPQRQAVERARTVLQDIRRLEADRGIRSEETQTEYPRGRLSRVQKEPSILERVFSRRGGLKTEGYEAARDMHRSFVRMTPEEARAFVPRGAPLRYIGQGKGGVTMLKFTEGPEGLAARDQFNENVAKKLKLQRSLRGGSASSWIRQGDVRMAKKLVKATEDVPGIDEVILSSDDPIPADVAKEMFVQSPSTRMKATTDKSTRNIARATAQENLSKLVDHKGRVAQPVPANVRRGQESANAPEGYEYMEGDKIGALSGQYVRSNVAKIIKGSYGKEAMSNGEGFSRAAMEAFKIARLLPSPRTWFRQFPSNFEFENAMGLSNWNPEWVGHKVRGLRAMRPGSKYYDDLVAEGFLDPATITLEELGVAERDFLKEGNAGYRWTKAVLTGGLSEAFPRQHRSAVEWLGRRYGFADGWTKATGYVHARESLGMDHQQAAEFVRKWTPSPDAVSDVVRWWSTHLVGDPWARFRAETARINLLLAKEKPVRFAMNWNQKHLIRAALVAAGASALSDDEEDALENEQGEGVIAVGKDAEGRPLGIDYTYFSILGDRFDTPSRVGKSGFEHTLERGLQITGLGDNPIYRAGARQITRHDEYGRQINPEGTLRGGVSALAKDLVAGWVPDLATRHQQKLRAAWQGKPYSPNQPVQTKTQAVLDVFFGLKLTPLDAEQALRKIQRQGASALDDYFSVVTKGRLQDPDADPAPDIERAHKLAQLLHQELAERSAPLKRMADLKASKSK